MFVSVCISIIHGVYMFLARVIAKFFGLVGGWGDMNMQLAGVGKLNGWVLKLNFADQIIYFKSLF